MKRWLWLWLLGLLVVVWLPAELCAQPVSTVLAQETLKDGWSGPGFYFSFVKMLLLWGVFALWVATNDWANRDMMEHDFEYPVWNNVLFFVFLGSFLLALILPWFLVSFPLVVLAWAVPLGLYIANRNKRVEANEKVLTAAHFRRIFARMLKPAGVKVEAEPVDPRDAGPPINLAARGGPTPRDEAARLLASRQAPGFADLRKLLADAISRRADSVLLDYTQQGVSRRYFIDGVWHNVDPMEREIADPLLEALKLLSGANPEDRQRRQQGKFAAKFQSASYQGTMVSQGTKTGERVIIQLEGQKTRFKTLEELGMRPKMQDQLKEILGRHQGFVVFSALPGSGLRTTVTTALQVMDRFTRDFISVEDESNRADEVENVVIKTYRSAEGQTPASILRDVFLLEPGVVVIRDLADAPTVSRMCAEVSEGRLLIGSIRAAEAAEAILKLLALGIRPEELSSSLTAVVCQRLVRKLCEYCKEAYTPPPQTLQQLGIPAGRIEVLFRPPEHAEEPCPHCQGTGYFGRTGIFEMIVVDNGVRAAIAGNGKIEAIRQAARKSGWRSLREEGILVVANGVTSVAELSRVLRQPAEN